MDVNLNVFGEELAFSLNDVDVLSTGDISTRLTLHSGCFMAAKTIIFEHAVMERFIHDIQVMDRDLAGTAELEGMHEHDRIRFQIDHRGGVRVSGIIYQDGNVFPDQELRFAFDADQTCLRPLWRDLVRIIALK
jgi:hypothetical protein